MEYRLVHDVQQDDCYFQKDSACHENQQSNTSCNHCGKNSKSLVFLVGFAVGIFVTFVICFVMEMIIQHKPHNVQTLLQLCKKTSKQTNRWFNTPRKLRQVWCKKTSKQTNRCHNTPRNFNKQDMQVVTTKMSEVFTTKQPYRGKNMLT